MYDHHTVVYDYAKEEGELAARGFTPSAAPQDNCYGNTHDIIMGTKGVCHLGQYRIQGETNWEIPRTKAKTFKSPYVLEQKALIEAVRSGKPINSGYHMVDAAHGGVLLRPCDSRC